MRKKLATSQRSVQHELATIATTLRQINSSMKDLIAVDEEAEERERSYRVIPSAPGPRYLNGRWKLRDGTLYHPLDEKGGALENEQREYQKNLSETGKWTESVRGRNTDPE